jgi:uncharacterized protein (DUF58 family)
MSISYRPLLEELRGTQWPARRAERGRAAPPLASRRPAASSELAAHRQHRGEASRAHGWTLFAHRGRADRHLPHGRPPLATVLLVDASASMALPTPTPAPSKWSQACQLAVGLAAVAHAAGDPVGIIVSVQGGPRLLAPRQDDDVLDEIAHLLAAVTPAGDASLTPALAMIPATHRVAIISDFLTDPDPLALPRAASDRLAAGGDVYAVHLLAPAEAARDHRATPTLAEPRSLPTPPQPAHSWRASGAAYTQVSADEPTARAVQRIVSLRSS